MASASQDVGRSSSSDDAEQYYLDPYFSDDKQKNEWVGEYYYGEDGYYN